MFRKINQWLEKINHRTVGCCASKTDIPYVQAKMKVQKMTFFMTNQVVLDLGGSPKLILVLYLSCILCYGPKTMSYYPQNIWKMTIFWKLYTGQWQTASLLVKVVPFLIVISTPYTVFATFCPNSCNQSLKCGKSLLISAIFGASDYTKFTCSYIFTYPASNIYWKTFKHAKVFFSIKKAF